MLYLTLLILGLLAIGLYAQSRSILHPGLVTCLLWGGMLVLYALFGRELNTLSVRFYQAVLIWAVPFSVVSLWAGRRQPLPLTCFDDSPNEKVLRYIAPVLLVALVLNILALVQRGMAVGGGNLLGAIRTAAVADMAKNGSMPGLPIWGTLAAAFVGVFAFPTCFALCASKQYNRRWVTIIVIAAVVLLTLLKSNKTAMAQLGLAFIVVLWARKLIKKRYIVYAGGGLILLLLLGHVMRRGSDASTFDFGHFLDMYLLSPLPAFDYLLNLGNDLVETFHGEFTFRSLVRVLRYWDPTWVGNHDPYMLDYWVSVPVHLNVYTVLMPFYEDYGLWGIAGGGMFYGWVSGHLYRGMQQGLLAYETLYCSMFYVLVFQFFNDFGMLFLGNQIMLFVGAVLLNYKPTSCPAK